MALHQRGCRDAKLQKDSLLAQECLRQEQAVSGEGCALKDEGLV